MTTRLLRPGNAPGREDWTTVWEPVPVDGAKMTPSVAGCHYRSLCSVAPGGVAQRWSQGDQPKGRVKLAQVTGVGGDDWLASPAGADYYVGIDNV